jgi:subtilisin-like proprotein convertase family protein
MVLAQVNGGAWTIQITPLGTAAASVPITLTVADPVNDTTNSALFHLIVQPPPVPNIFAATAPIAATGYSTNSPANNYPSTITVSGLSNTVFQVQVILNGFSDNAPASADVLLVGPNNTKVMLMSGMGSGGPANNLRITFDDSAPLLSPNGVLSSSSYHAADYSFTDVLPAAPSVPSPARPYGSRLSDFNGMNPNGAWSLYVSDHQSGDVVQVLGGWSLVVKTTPNLFITSTTPSTVPLTFTENTSATINFSVEDISTAAANLTVSASSDNPNIIPSSGISFSVKPPATNMSVTITPALYQSGSNNLTLTVARADGASTSVVIPVVVTPINVAPVITRIANLTAAENSVSKVDFIVSDVDTPLSRLQIIVDSDNHGLLDVTNIVLPSGSNSMAGLPPNVAPGASDVTLTLSPVAFSTGQAHVTVTVNDPGPGSINLPTSTTTSFLYTVTNVVSAPVISQIPPQSVAGGNTISIPFTVFSGNSPTPTVSVTASSEDQTMVKNANISVVPASASGTGSGTNRTLVLTAEHPASGTVTIDVNATDGTYSSPTMKFLVTIRRSRDQLFSNSAGITINDFSPASPYPSTNLVSGFQGPISKLNVIISGFGHAYPSDVGMLLVSPSGQNLVLQNKAGDGHSVSGINLTFDQSSTNGPIPQSQPLATGSWLPADYKPAGYSFFSPAPASPYTNSSLNAFNGSNPNGTWLLYVEDDTLSDAGQITGGWSLDITTSPVFQNLVNLTNIENSMASESFSVLDDSPSAPNFTFAYTSTNTVLVPNGTNVTFAGSANAWTLNIFPTTNAVGTTKITVVATDGDGFAVTNSFLYVVTPVNYPPLITQISDINMQAGTVATAALSYSDIGYANNQLTVTIGSSNPNVLPIANIALVGGNLQFAPVGNLPGSSRVTVTVSQPAGTGSLSTNMSFNVNVVESETPLAANTNSIVINDDAPASPYPSQVILSGLYPRIAKATVTLLGFAHSFPSDVSALLVGPAGQTVVLMSRAGDGQPVTGVNLTFDDSAANALPQNSQLATGTYQPTDYKSVDSFFPGAPSGPYGKTLNSLVGSNPNGTWSLYVQDDLSPDGGIVAGGWLLNIETVGPMISGIAPQTVAENGTLTVPFTVLSLQTGSSNLLVSAATSQDSPSGLIQSLTITGTNINRSLVITPAANMPSVATNGDGSDVITITVTDVTNKYTNTLSFPLIVSYVDQAPVISGLTDIATPANVAVLLPFNVSDIDTALSNLTSSVSLSTNIGSVSLVGTGGSQSVAFAPNGILGTAVATVAVSDGTITTSKTFNITVTTGVAPAVSAIPAQTVPENGVLAPVPFTIANADLPSLSVTASADNPSLVSGVTIGGTGTNLTASVTLVPYASGSSMVTIVASNQFGSGSGSFVINVTPVYYPPTVQPIGDVTTTANTPVRVPLVVADLVTAISNLTYSYSVSNTGLVSSVTFAVSGTNVLATITPAPNVIGAADLTLIANDGVSSVGQSFAFIVNAPPTPSFAAIPDQTGHMGAILNIPLTISDSVLALSDLSYKATYSNSNLVSSVRFSIFNRTNAQATVFLANNAFGSGVLTFSVNDGFDTVSQAFALSVIVTPPGFGSISDVATPANTPVTVTLGVTPQDTPLSQLVFSYKVSNSNVVNSITFGVAGGVATASITPAKDSVGSAAITIYVSDSVNTESQSFDFVVTNPAGPTIAAIPDQITPKNAILNIPLTISDSTTALINLNYTASFLNSNLVSSVKFSISGGTNVQATVVLVNGAYGADAITVYVSDGFTTAFRSFAVLVLPTPPSLAPIPDVTTAVGGIVNVPLNVVSPDTALSQLTFSGSSTNSDIVSGVSFATVGSTVSATVNLVPNKTGKAAVQILVSDGYSTSAQTFSVNVTSSLGGPTLHFALVGKVFKISFTGVPNASYVILSSSNLQGWAAVGPAITADSNGKVEYDATVGSSGAQYYRAELK